ncbi:SAM-dependent methyltransferase [Thiohalomonas denitrificans]|uniref:SAM-dependent methyltransferase n=1 Tax=Thiohalomonas denitrificans TaxID=415747 RepID=UPI0026F09F55|nr:cyclopropane-fatty-acyl-phospholipid synthase family protein [Thiohalomonas denitrificans]
MQKLFLRTLEKNLHRGSIEVHLPNGDRHRFGQEEPLVSWRFDDRRATGRIARVPELALGETYMDGAWDTDDLAGLLVTLMENFPQRSGRMARLTTAIFDWFRPNWIGRSRRNVAHHYDLDEALFRTFLDEDLQYSCAYFERPEMDLEAAQKAKCRHIAEKLLPEPGQRVLDIGSGWGGMAIRLAEEFDVDVTGLTLSTEQQRVATQRARERGVAGKVRFHLQDYREHAGQYDRIVSIGMFEHVGRAQYPTYFQQVKRLLATNGVALIHSIGCFTPSGSNPWIQRYIFPGGRIPTLAEIGNAAGTGGLVTADVEVWRLHYARTLAEWQDRFQRQRTAVVERFGERFYRMWTFYLASCEAAFRARGMAVFQFQLSQRLDTVPLTRDYLYARQPAAQSRISATPATINDPAAK